MRSLLSVAGSVVVVLGLVACSAPDDPLPGLATSRTASPTSSATPTPSPTINYSDADLGIVFEDDAEQWTGAEAEVYHWTAKFETEYWRSMTTNTVSPVFGMIASPEAEARMQQIVDTNVGIQGSIGGTFHVEVREIVVDGETARSVTCLDYRDATFADPNGTYPPDEVGFGGITRRELTLERVADETWIVLTSTVAEATC